MIEYLSPREVDDLQALLARGEAWPRLLLEAFSRDARLLLGWDQAQGEHALTRFAADRVALRAALERAGRWCAEHGLHLMAFEETEPRADADADRRWFMAVG